MEKKIKNSELEIISKEAKELLEKILNKYKTVRDDAKLFLEMQIRLYEKKDLSREEAIYLLAKKEKLI